MTDPFGNEVTTICPKCMKPTFRKSSHGKTTCFECMTRYPNIPTRSIPEILLEHGFTGGPFSFYKGRVMLYHMQRTDDWFLDRDQYLPNLTPDNLPTLLHILGINE